MDAGIKLNKSFLELERFVFYGLVIGAGVFYVIGGTGFSLAVLGCAAAALLRCAWILYYGCLFGRQAVLCQSVPLSLSLQVRSKIYQIGWYCALLCICPLAVLSLMEVALFSVGNWLDSLIQPFVDELAVLNQLPLIIPFSFLALVGAGFAAAAGGFLGIVLYQSMQVAKRRTWITASCGLLGAGLTATAVWGSWMIFDWMMWEFSVMRPLVCIVMALILLELAVRASIKLLEKHYRTNL